MSVERCEDCAFCAELEKMANTFGYQKSLCCIALPVIYHAGYVTEVFSNDRCELFIRRVDE